MRQISVYNAVTGSDPISTSDGGLVLRKQDDDATGQRKNFDNM